MIQFKSIIAGMHYMDECPVCSATLEVDKRDAFLQGYASDEWGNNTLTFYHGNGTIDIELISDNISLITNNINTNTTLTRTGNITQYWNRTTQTTGLLMVRLCMLCDKCDMYSYTLQIHISLDENVVSGIYLNSESISIENSDDIVYEINNIYATDKTSFREFMPGCTDKETVLPLIPMNHNNPKETLNRIKSLLIFS